MGIPITTYTVLDSLAAGDGDPHFRRLIAPFNLFAFILGSPKSNPRLFATIDSSFDRLAFETGEKLLFFALAKPSNARWRGERSNAYARFVEFQPPSIGPDHEAALADAIALGLGIPQSALPCIVVTNDLKSKELVWFSTSADSVADQLRRLGYIAWQHNRDRLKDVLSDEQKSFESSKPSGSASLDVSVAQAIVDVLSFPVYGAGRSDVKNATYRARQTLGGIFRSINDHKSTSADLSDDEPDSSLLQQLESSGLKWLSCLALLSEEPDVFLYPDAYSSPLFARSKVDWERASSAPQVHEMDYESELAHGINIPTEDSQRWPSLRRLGGSLESQSIHMLKTALLVQDLFDARPDLLAGLLEPQIDYTPTVICLAKVFEREANLSVVHWVRAHLHISLPPYFNKYQPEIQAVFTPNVPNPHGIDFNRERNGIWIAPGMGQSELACRELGRTSLPSGWNQHQWNRLMDGWHVIRVRRNAATHTELIDKHSAMQVGEAIDRLAKDKIFESMSALKAKYRGA